MRNIKLRQPVWENGKFIKWHYWGQTGNGLYQLPINTHESDQFTGLLDKKGVEIYEGDIVEVESTGMNHRSDMIKGKIEFVDGCFDVVFSEPVFDVTLKTYRPRLYVKCFTGIHAIKVIGNIEEEGGIKPEGV